MSTSNVKEIVREKYGHAALHVKSDAGNCCCSGPSTVEEFSSSGRFFGASCVCVDLDQDRIVDAVALSVEGGALVDGALSRA